MRPAIPLAMDSEEEDRANGASEDEQPVQGSEDEGNLDQEELEEEARDLFGGEEDEAQEDRDEEPAEIEQEPASAPHTLYRHPIPDSSDGETYLLKVPKFLTVDPVAFSLQGFQPPEDPQAKDGKPSTGFSAYETALSTIRWRHSPSNPSEIQSNARILRWSDGSLTLQLASDPVNQYVIQAERLAPRQINPAKPTPVSIIDKSGRTGRPYSKRDDVSAYLFTPSRESYALRATNKLTASLNVLPNTKKNDEALLRLQQSTAAANRTILGEGGTFKLEETLEDPDLQRKQAEVAEKEKQRAQRRAENAQTRQMIKNAGTLGRVGVGRSGGLTAADLEGDELGAGYGRRAGASRPRKRTNRRGDRSESEEMDYEDEDDEGFIAKDDEEEEEDEEESEEDELERQEAAIEKYEAEQRTPKKAAPKRVTPDEESEAVDPASQGSPVSRQKRRRVIEEDEDEE